ncbi:Chromatin assembly factor 1 subunit [Microbotryomycetes sp. JL201]|nr:Chromatin assembly factor 1 subunit [Microbotryomycetes sp. JL201]
MRCKVVEIRWHETTPIFSADFHPVQPTHLSKPVHPFMKQAGAVDDTATTAAAAAATSNDCAQGSDKMWRLATCGGDKHVRLWLVHPRPPQAAPPVSLVASSLSAKPVVATSAKQPTDSGPTVEYLATLKQHAGVVNVVRFRPTADDMLASAGDDGNIVFWVPGGKGASFGDSLEERQYERESWRVKSMCRTKTGAEIYDLTFSPDGQRVLTGSVDHTANIWDVATGQLIHTIAEHTNYVQGVAWDPFNQFIATQSSDRSMHVYSIADAGENGVSVHAVGKNSRMDVQHRAGGTWRPPTPATPSESGKAKELEPRPARPRSLSRDSIRSETSSYSNAGRPTLPTMATSTSAISLDDEEENSMDPPASRPARSLSRRSSSASASHSGPSPAIRPHVRSPSPAPLPAVRVPLSPTVLPTSGPSSDAKVDTLKLYSDANSTPFFRRLAWSPDGSLLVTPAGMFEDPFAVVVPKDGTTAATTESSKKDKGKDKALASDDKGLDARKPKPTVYLYSRANIARPPVAHLPGHKTTSIGIRFCPVLWHLRQLGSANADQAMHIDLDVNTKDVKLPSAESATVGDAIAPASLFNLPYRMVYAVATLDTVFLYDTQQAGPICMFGNLHYAPFTDMTWTADGETLVLTAQDGYCSVIAFEPGELGQPYESTIHELAPPPDVPRLVAPQPVSSTGNTIPAMLASRTVTSVTASPSATSSVRAEPAMSVASSKREPEPASGEPSAKKQFQDEVDEPGEAIFVFDNDLTVMMKCSRTYPCSGCEMRDLDCKWTAPPAGSSWPNGESELAAAQAEVARLRALVDLLMMRLSEVDDTASAYGVLGLSPPISNGASASSSSIMLPSPRVAVPSPQFPLPTNGIPGLSFLQGYGFPSALTPARSTTSSSGESMDESSRSDSEEWQTAAGAYTSSSDWTAASFSGALLPMPTIPGTTSAKPGDIYVAQSAAAAASGLQVSITSGSGSNPTLVPTPQDSPSGAFSSHGSSGLAQYHLF